MNEKEAKEIIKNYVLENFDDTWYPGPTYIKEYSDYFKFYINSKKSIDTNDFHYSYVGLGAAFLSKQFGEIIQYGSALAPFYATRIYLMAEYRIAIVRTKYTIGRADYGYQLIIENVKNLDKAIKYIEGIFVYEHSNYVKEIRKGKLLEIPLVDYFSLLNFLYFNVIDSFCDCACQIRIQEYEISKPLRKYKCDNSYEFSNIMFDNYMTTTVIEAFPLFNLNDKYSVHIVEILDINKLLQYIETSNFAHYGEDEAIGMTGYVSYRDYEIEEILKKENKTFEYVDAKEIVFFLFANIKEPFCEVEIRKITNLLPEYFHA